MIRCPNCSKDNPESARFCDECGTKLIAVAEFLPEANGQMEPTLEQTETGQSLSRPVQVTSVGVPPIIERPFEFPDHGELVEPKQPAGAHATLVIERGDSANTEFQLWAEESNIGRWDADNGIFPDVDLDSHDPDAKVSRRHARIMYRGNIHMIEDLGSTNGTFLNRGRRLLPGSPQVLTEGDEIIVGKTFLRFHIVN
ncbi:MAG TPA: FHA domain-containing protein [Pyrinomonadaceae bacterium]|nr:FHA domain-containing protein [Pyrinomonadaceae bacterium]